MSACRHPEVLAKEAAGLLRELAASDLSDLTGQEAAELALATSEVANLAAAARVAAVRQVESSKVWAADGSQSSRAWLAWHARLPRSEANAIVRCARQLRALPGAEAAFLAGLLTVDHVRLLARAQRCAPDRYEIDERRLLEHAVTFVFSRFEQLVRHWCNRHDADGSERDAAQRWRDRRVHCSPTLDGMVVLDAFLDPITGAIVRRELLRLEQQLFEADWATAREQQGDAATAADLPRTPAQRRADALRLMAERSAAKPAGAVEPRVLVHVLAGTEAMERMCQLSDGTVVTPGEVLPLLRWADLSRVIFDGPSRAIDIGVRQRLFTGATRTAVELRDLVCQHPGCDVPAERCEIDHIEPYEAGGLTVQANGICRCPHHHRWRHRRPQPVA